MCTGWEWNDIWRQACPCLITLILYQLFPDFYLDFILIRIKVLYFKLMREDNLAWDINQNAVAPLADKEMAFVFRTSMSYYFDSILIYPDFIQMNIFLKKRNNNQRLLYCLAMSWNLTIQVSYRFYLDTLWVRSRLYCHEIRIIGHGPACQDHLVYYYGQTFVLELA